MNISCQWKLLLVSGSLLVVAASSEGQALYDNLKAVTSRFDSIQAVGPLYDSFSDGVMPDTVTGVWLNLINPAGSGGSFSVGIYADSGSISPGALITSAPELDAFVSGTGTLLDVTFTTPVDVNPNTRYWIGLTPSPFSGIAWNASLDISGPGVAGEYYDVAGGVFPNVTGPYQMQLIEVDGIPEPAPWLGLGLGIGVLALRRRR
jgi:hypothetical protein